MATSGATDAEALAFARELLGCVMFGLEEDGEEIPEASALSSVATGPDKHTALVDVYMSSVRQNKNIN